MHNLQLQHMYRMTVKLTKGSNLKDKQTNEALYKFEIFKLI